MSRVRRPTTALRVACMILASACVVDAQNIVVFDSAAASFGESPSLSPVFPAGGPLQQLLPVAFPLGPSPAAPIPAGGVAIESTNGRVWYSNGLLIAAMPNTSYLGPAFPPAPPWPPFPPVPFPPTPGMPGWVTGLAVDPIANLLWMTDGFFVQATSTFAPVGPLVVPPFPVGFPGGPLTGLEWDGLTNSFWGVTVGGFAVNFIVGGAPIGPFLPPLAGMPMPPTGITIDKTGLPSPLGPARSLYVLSVGVVFDYTTGVAQPAIPGPGDGLGFDPMPIEQLPVGCACPKFFTPMLQPLNPAMTGNFLVGMDWAGLPAFSPVIVAIDVTFNPAFPLVNGVGCPLGMNLASPTLILWLMGADAFGRFSLPFGLANIPPGIRLYAQYAAPCASDPAGIVLSSMIEMTVCAP